MRNLFLILAIVLLSITIAGQAPPNYYSSASGLSGTALQQALHNIIKDHDVQTYGSLYNHFQTTDRKPNLTVWDMYSDVPGGTPPYVYLYNAGMECGNYNGEGQCYNREHSFPTSWFGGNVLPMYSDLFHLYPTDGYVNNRRANYPFGKVSNASWTSMNGSKVGNNTSSGYSGVVFEPINAYKGDFARTMFYMAVRYYSQDNSWPGSPMTDKSQLKPWALELMKAWHLQDPVSEKEISRNNAVFNIQANRNPFIDHPEFVWTIWGGASNVNETPFNPVIAVYPVPANDFCHLVFSEPSATVPALTVYDVSGRVIPADYKQEQETIILNTSGLDKGFYLVSILLMNRDPLLIKIIK